MVGSGFGRGVRAVGRILGAFGKGGIGGGKRSVNFVGRNVEKAEIRFCVALEVRPVGAGFFEKAEGAVNVSPDEVIGAVNGAVHVALGGKVDDSARAMSEEQLGDQFPVANITLQ